MISPVLLHVQVISSALYNKPRDNPPLGHWAATRGAVWRHKGQQKW